MWNNVETSSPRKWKIVWLYSETYGVFLGYNGGNYWKNHNGVSIHDVTHWCELIIPNKPV